MAKPKTKKRGGPRKRVLAPREPKPLPEVLVPEGRGWNNKFETKYIEMARKLAVRGFLIADLADFFDVDARTINNWFMAYPEFADACKNVDLSEVNGRIEGALAQAAIGYERIEEEIKIVDGTIHRVKVRKYYPPQSAMAIWWTKAKMGWRDDIAPPPPEPDGPLIEGVNITTEPIRQIARRIALVLYNGGKAS